MTMKIVSRNGFTPLKNATHRDKALRSSIGNLSLTGFTTIEIAIVIVAAVVLIGIIFFAIKPSQQLIDLGYKNVYNLEGGMNAWQASGKEIYEKG